MSLENRSTLQTTKKELKALFHVYPFVPLDFLYLLCYLYSSFNVLGDYFFYVLLNLKLIAALNFDTFRDTKLF